MTHERARQLTAAYFAGETTLAEERSLAAYYREGPVDPGLRPNAPLFAYWDRERRVAAPPAPGRRRRLPRLLLALAAALLLLLVARYAGPAGPALNDFPVAERQPVDWSRYEVTDRREAFTVLKSAFGVAGEALNRGPSLTIRELRLAKDILD